MRKSDISILIFNIFLIAVSYLVVYIPTALLLLFIVQVIGGVESEGAFIASVIGIAGGGFISLPLCLFPSYKISLWLSEKVKDWWGWEIEKPKKLFWLSVLLIILLVFVLPFVVNSLF